MDPNVIKGDLRFGIRQEAGGKVEQTGPGSWRFSLPEGVGHSYRWAQLDDYLQISRRAFQWHPPMVLSLKARVSAPDLPGTWGFGLWNDPFTISVGLGGMARRTPALPNTAWFFYASPPNYLSLRDSLPADGFLAATFRSPRIPSALMALALPGVPLLGWPPSARLLRRLARRIVSQSAVRLDEDVTAWHAYSLEWKENTTVFCIDGRCIHTTVSPRGPLGLVLWIDNQYAAFTPGGRLSFGSLAHPEAAWMEIDELRVA